MTEPHDAEHLTTGQQLDAEFKRLQAENESLKELYGDELATLRAQVDLLWELAVRRELIPDEDVALHQVAHEH